MTIDLNRMLQPGGIVPIDIPTTAALVAEVQRLREEVEADNRNLEQLTDEVAQCSKARADLEAENANLKAVLKDVGLFLHHCWCDVQMNEYSFDLLNKQMAAVDAALESKP